MKKIITLLITAAMVLSVCAMPAMAAVSTTEMKANFNLEDAVVDAKLNDLTDKTNTYNTSTSAANYFNYNSNKMFMKINNNSTSCIATVEQETPDNKVLKVVKKTLANQGRIDFVYLPSFQGDQGLCDEEQLICRTSDAAFSFRVKLPTNSSLEMYTGGQLSTDEEPQHKQDGTKLIVKSYAVENGLEIYSYTKDTDTKDTNVINDSFSRDEWTEFKIIYDYDNGTYDVYVNNKLIAENQGLKFTKYLLGFEVRIYLAKGEDYNPVAYIDDIKFYTVADADTKVQPNVSKSGNGTVEVTAPDTVVKVNDNVTYTVTPDDNGSYIEEVTKNGASISTFDEDGYTYTEQAAAGNKLEVKFADYVEEKPSIAVSPFKFTTSEASYVFFRMFYNNTTPDEFGILLSTDEEPALDDAVAFDATKTTNSKGVNTYGYFGYEIINETDATKCYVQPYAKIGEEYTYGNIEAIDLETAE